MSRQPPGELVQAAQAACKQYGVLPSVSLAQGILESAWFSKCTGKFNFFGIKAVKDQPFTISWTHEYIDDKYVAVQQKFANYNSAQDAFEAHAEMLVNPRGNFARAIPFLNNVEKYIKSISLPNKPAYATDPDYAEKLLNLIHSQNLTVYDIVGKHDASA